MRELLRRALKRPLIGGHRGCACTARENSIEAMQEGMRRGADYLEIDVQLTSDCVPVVFHDVRLEARHSPLSGYVHEASYASLLSQVKELCTLQQALEWGYKENAFFALELKTVPLDMQLYTFKLVELIAKMLPEAKMLERVFVFGQDYQVLAHLHKINPQIMLGIIVPFVPSDPVALMRQTHASIYLSYIYNMTQEIITSLQANGFYVSGAILRDEKWVLRARKLGVDMFESDEPQKHKKLIDEQDSI